jgi:prepilin-type N-terminal cleavage/methylation domain-containing protein
MLQRLHQARKNESGFTLIELLIVIVILGVLSAIVVFAVGGITDTGKKSACKSDVKTVEVASEAYFATKGIYATAIDDGTHSATTLVGAKFLREAPTAPATDYVITYNATGGTVAATGACTVTP